MSEPNLSHFESMARWMAGHGKGVIGSGWLGRYLDGLDGDPLRAGHRGHLDPTAPEGRQAPGDRHRHLDGRCARGRVRQAHREDRQTKQHKPHLENLRMFDAIALMAANRGGATMADQLAFMARDAVALAGTIAPVYAGLQEEGWRITRQLEIAARLINANLGVRVVNVSLGGSTTTTTSPMCTPPCWPRWTAG